MSIRFEHVTKSFGLKRVLENISFEVNRGEILFIIGKSGVGKSITLKHIVGLTKPDSGSVFIDDQEVTTLSPLELANTRLKCGMVFQHPALLDSLTIYENIAFGLKTQQYQTRLGSPLTEEKIFEIVNKKLALVHLPPHLLSRYPQELSYGMQKRVSLARALAIEPNYLLFDEPTTGLDPITTQAINNLIFDLSRRLHVTSVVVSHDMACALKIADRILVLDQGRILEHSSIVEIKNSPNALIHEFLSETLSLPPSQ